MEGGAYREGESCLQVTDGVLCVPLCDSWQATAV